MKSHKKILLIILVACYALLFSEYLLPNYSLDFLFWFILLLPIFTIVVLGILFFDSDTAKKAYNEEGPLKAVLLTAGGIILIAITWIVSTMIVIVVHLSNNPPEPSSTYGTPIYRPKIMSKKNGN